MLQNVGEIVGIQLITDGHQLGGIHVFQKIGADFFAQMLEGLVTNIFVQQFPHDHANLGWE